MSANLEAIRESYVELFGHVPEQIEARIDLGERFGRLKVLEAIELLREQAIKHSGCEPVLQQLLHFALLVGMKETAAAKLHAAGALRSGTRPEHLWAVCETAAVVGGMPMFSLSVEALHLALRKHNDHMSQGVYGEDPSEVS